MYFLHKNPFLNQEGFKIYFNRLVLFIFLLIGGINVTLYGKSYINNDDISKHLQKMCLYDESANFELLFVEMDSLKNISQERLTKHIREKILKPKDLWEREKAITYAGIFKLKEVKNLIDSLINKDRNILTSTAIYFYYYSIDSYHMMFRLWTLGDVFRDIYG